MFSNINNRKNTNTEPKDKNVRDEEKIQNEDGNAVLSTGNENVNNLINNHINNDRIDNDNEEEPEEDNIAVRLKKKVHINNAHKSGGKTNNEKNTEKQQEKIAENIIIQNAPQILNLINNDTVLNKQNGKNRFERDAKINGLPLSRKEIIDDDYNEDEPEEDNIAVRLKKKTRIKKAPKDENKIVNDNVEDQDKAPKPGDKIVNDNVEIQDGEKINEPKEKINIKGANDLVDANNDMERIQGHDFTPLEFPGRRKASGISKFFTGVARFFGKTLGKLLNIIISPFSALHLYRGLVNSKKNNENLTQKKRTHDTIPGWNGRKFEEDPEGNANILADFRQVPTVWSRMTAAKAVDADGKPLPPEVSIYVNQPKEGSDQMMDGLNSGHSGMGIEYTRFSKAANRYERYDLRFGFWQAGASSLATRIMNTYKGAVTLGQLSDENGVRYTISRKFKTSSRQVNDILKAARTYPDKGYHPFMRNCTTFVRDMMQAGRIAGAENVITYDETELSHSANVSVFGAEMAMSNAQASQEQIFEKLGNQEDKSYAGWGNKRATQEDYDLYKRTMNNGTGLANANTILTNTPNSAAENLRRLKHNNAGDFGSYQYWDSSIAGKKDLANLFNACQNEGAKAIQIANTIDDQTRAASPGWEPDPELEPIKANLTAAGSPIEFLLNKIAIFKERNQDENFDEMDDVDWVLNNAIKVSDVRSSRQALSTNIEKANIMLNKYYKNDKRLHIPVMHLISTLSYAINHLDFLYRSASESIVHKDKELGDLHAEVKTKDYKFSFARNPNLEVSFTPTHYESYIQIYKDPAEAVKNYADYLALDEKDSNGQELTEEEENRLEKLKRMEDLADQFDTAHNYMLEKDSFSQQDIDYAFETSARQQTFNGQQNKIKSSIFNEHRTSGDAYQALFLQKIFGGMEDRFFLAEDEDSYMPQGKQNDSKLRKWLDQDMTECLNKKPQEMMMILRGMKKAMPEEEQNTDDIMGKAGEMLLYNWIMRIFKGTSTKVKYALTHAQAEFQSLMVNRKSNFRKTLEGMVKNLLDEDRHLAEASNQAGINTNSGKKGKIISEKIKKK